MWTMMLGVVTFAAALVLVYTAATSPNLLDGQGQDRDYAARDLSSD